MEFIDILLYPGFDELDAVGPYEVLESAGFDVRLVAASETVTASHGMTVVTDGDLRPAPSLDCLVVPGGRWNDRSTAGAWSEYENGRIPRVVAEYASRRVTVASVCTGAMLLAEAGVLDGRPATTHHTARDDLAAYDVDLTTDRVVDDGDVLTAGGVTAGIDLALRLVERERGPQARQSVQRTLEYGEWDTNK
ncbi:DJ-1/PfpI family protein [Halocalculus aciditolerans]|uniref:Thimanine synthesis protein ThiJ n=1 Tax=Halocalculus aciditolerans TaxID=1383812 RepID=A0A830FMY7_9EURY|nr:DJ-1/PfpI family protein [Halocalculus aciditolerans]GGL68791.1 thimanine synthesis protein ThiJ [Halocalculus aciditolerans]